jgi:hypothetical protein
MDPMPLLLSRLQSAFAVSYHIIFPSFAIGLAAEWIRCVWDAASAGGSRVAAFIQRLPPAMVAQTFNVGPAVIAQWPRNRPLVLPV